ncbi:MAG: zinc-ribbon domain-containing protein [Reyranella sp.]|nr:MAG: zinc-ribbon domain-containing protein [Reyranella sp.]
MSSHFFDRFFGGRGRSGGHGLGRGHGERYYRDADPREASVRERVIVCPACRSDNQPDSRFCGNCGRQLGAASIMCSKCNTAIANGAKFCSSCGTAASSAP